MDARARIGARMMVKLEVLRWIPTITPAKRVTLFAFSGVLGAVASLPTGRIETSSKGKSYGLLVVRV